LPIAFGRMPYGQLFAVFFFVMLFFAAFTSAISLLEPTVAWLIERLHMSRAKAASTAGLLIWFVGIGTVLSFNVLSEWTLFGRNFFNFLDYLTANIMLPLGGLLIAVFSAWRLQKVTTLNELNFKNGWYYKSWRMLLGIVTPIAISLVFLRAIGLL
ncbi:unnamed protein product, partial [marine sediment metagenome]